MITKREIQLVIAQLIEQTGVLLKFTEALDKRVKAIEDALAVKHTDED